MSREIKFRGKRVDNSEWVYGKYFVINARHYIVVNGNDRPNYTVWFGHTNADAIFFVEVHPETVGQFTGRKDWWEGDIAEQNGIIYIVVCEDCAFRFKTKSGGLVTMQGWNPEPNKIGNIHDNKELLDAKETVE